MADGNEIKNKNRGVDDAGIRLAPTPIHNSSYHVMPTVMQEFVISPRIEVEEETQDGDFGRETTTANDFQPRKEDIGKKWKRRKRSKNMILGVIMFIITAIVVLPFILGAAGVMLKDFAFKYVPETFGAIRNIVEAFKITAEFGWKGDIVNQVWIYTVPSLILLFGIIFLAINLIKSLVAIIATPKPVKYTSGALIYLFSVLAVFIASLVGAETIGVAKIDFVKDFIHGYATSELFSLIVFAAGYFVISAICTAIGSDKFGYLR